MWAQSLQNPKRPATELASGFPIHFFQSACHDVQNPQKHHRLSIAHCLGRSRRRGPTALQEKYGTPQHFRNDLRLRGDWNLLKGKLQQAYTQLTDEDLIYVEDGGHELVSRLQVKLGKRKRQIVKLLNTL